MLESRSRICFVRIGSASIVDSVISSSSSSGSIDQRSSRPWTSVGNWMSSRLRVERLTAIARRSPSSSHARHWRSASSIT